MSEQKKYLSAEEIFAEEEQEELRREQKRLADLHDSEVRNGCEDVALQQSVVSRMTFS